MFFIMHIILLHFLFCLISKASTTEICTVEQNPCKCVMDGGQIIDLTSVGIIDLPRFTELKSNNLESSELYSYNPCYAFDSKDQRTKLKEGTKPCKNAAACIRTPGGSDGSLPEEYAIGLQATGTFGSVEPWNLHINYTVPDTTQKLLVQLLCDKNVTDDLIVYDDVFENNLHVMTLTSRCACPNGCTTVNPAGDNPGLSLGSKLLIAFFTILLAYFLVGILWNCFNGAKGTEIIPNVEFWNEMPKLIIEGIQFTCTCFGRRASYTDM